MSVVKFMFDYGANSCLWAVDCEAVNKLGEGVIPLSKISVSNDLKETIECLCREYDSSLNWDDPTAGTPWTSQQIESFRERAVRAYNDFVNEVRDWLEVQNYIDLCLEF